MNCSSFWLAGDNVWHDGEPSSEIKHLITLFAKDYINWDAHPFQAVGSAYLLDNAEDPQNKALFVMIWPPGDRKLLCYIVAGCIGLGSREHTTNIDAQCWASLQTESPFAASQSYHVQHRHVQDTWRHGLDHTQLEIIERCFFCLFPSVRFFIA